MAKIVTFHSFFSIALAITTLSLLTLTQESNGCFSIDLIHRDSPKSPFYDRSLSHSQRVFQALQRSIRHARHYHNSSSASTDLIPSMNGDYLINISIGTPPVKILAVADTGSDLIWIPCEPCQNCHKQINQPPFNPNASSTYTPVPCNSRPCQTNFHDSINYCNTTTKTCQYRIFNGDIYSSHGDLATEMFMLGSLTSEYMFLANTIFGCGHNNYGSESLFGPGIVGLGGGPLSLVSQLSSFMGGKFSYCLPPLESESTSKMHFGESGAVLGTGVVTTPIVSKNPNTYYYLTLEGLSVGGKRLDVYDSNSLSNASSISNEYGNIIIDSGPAITTLPSDLYKRFEAEVKIFVKLKVIPDPQQVLNLCFSYGPSEKVDTPNIEFHFKNADLALDPWNAFILTSRTSMCLNFLPAVENVAVFGNMAQMNFLVGYDLEKKIVSFKRTDCTKQ